jgi:hypothetical protein
VSRVGVRIGEGQITSDDTREWAWRGRLGAEEWRVSWILEGRSVSRTQAIAAVSLAAAIGRGLTPGDPEWPTVADYAHQLGYDDPEAVATWLAARSES